MSCQEVDPSKHMFYYLTDTKPYTFYENGVVETWNQGNEYWDKSCSSKGNWKLENDEIVVTGIHNNNCPWMEERNGRFKILGKISESSDNHYIEKIAKIDSKAKNNSTSNKVRKKNNTTSIQNPSPEIEKIQVESGNSQEKSKTDLVNYGEYYSNENGVTEKLFFKFNLDNGNFEVHYSTNPKKNIKLGVKNESVFFINKPNELYEIKEIAQDNSKFILFSVKDQKKQVFHAVEH